MITITLSFYTRNSQLVIEAMGTEKDCTKKEADAANEFKSLIQAKCAEIRAKQGPKATMTEIERDWRGSK